MTDETDPANVSLLLVRIGDGDASATDELLPLVYDQLRGMAHAIFASSRGHTLQPTALVHEAWMKMAGHLGEFENRRHFFAVAAKAMRQVLADHARAGSRDKRGGGRPTVTIDESVDAVARPEVDLGELHESLERLSALNERHARVVELRLLGAMTLKEIAETLGTSITTVHGDWSMARAWLRCELAAS